MVELDRLHYQSPLCTVGTFCCAPDDPRFEDSGPTNGALFVFPRTAVTITQAGAESVVADRNAVVFYNRHQEYLRGRISPEGDVSDWFSLSEEAVVDAIAEYDPAVVDRPERPYAFTWGPSSTAVYVRQRALLAAVTEGVIEPLQLEDAALDLLRTVVYDAYRLRGERRRPLTTAAVRRRESLAWEARQLLARSFEDRWNLPGLAQKVGTSPYHLSRVFRERFGQTVHAHLTQLRLRAALGRLVDPEADLLEIALDVGFTSHSHFTSAFRRAFGRTPSSLRTSLAGSARARSR